MFIKSFVLSASLALSALTSGAQAAVVTFENAPLGEYAGFETYVEDGFRYSVDTGGLFVNRWGNLNHDMEGSIGNEGGVLTIAAADSSLFTFQEIDYAAFESFAVGAQLLTVRGFLSGSEVGVDTFFLNNTATASPKYANWTTFAAVNLSGVSIDVLRITLNAGPSDAGVYLQAVDNVVLTSAVPEPSTWVMMIAGVGLAGAALRRRWSPLDAA